MKEYKLIGKVGKPYLSSTPGTFGGHRKLKVYGKLDCPSALRHIANGQYVQHRVFFANEDYAVAAGYRPCGVCMKESYMKWKNSIKE
jgi:methylphosphotriester-DNA--protein-cysteine methyltransferase